MFTFYAVKNHWTKKENHKTQIISKSSAIRLKAPRMCFRRKPLKEHRVLNYLRMWRHENIMATKKEGRNLPSMDF